MNQNSQISDDLLVKYLLKEATPAERLQVEQWVAADSANEKQFQQFLLIWDESKKLEQASTVDENAAWLRFKQKLDHKPAGNTITFPKQSFNWMRIAAMLILMIGGTWAGYYYLYSGRMITLNAEGAIVAQTLPDGTTVTLNKNATISYPNAFTGNTREITLNGEAFFNVTPDKSRPFIIHANEADVRVVGTSFNVKTKSDFTQVIVETGVVQVAKRKKMVTLNPKEKATVKKNIDQPLKEDSEDELYNYYRTKEFVCNATPLSRLVEVLNEAYGAQIIIANDNIKNLPLTTTFHNKDLDGILFIIGETFGIKVEKSGGQIILK